MPATLEEYVRALTDDEKIRIIDDHDILKESGAIGDEPIRVHTMAFLEQAGIPSHNVVMWMSLLAGECHVYFSTLYRSQMLLTKMRERVTISSPSTNEGRNEQMPATSKITYAIVRIDTDEDVTEIASRIQALEKDISCLTVIDVFGFKNVHKASDEKVGAPTLYWP